MFGGAAVELGARGEVGTTPPGAAAGAELVPCVEAGADAPGTPAGSGVGSVPSAESDPATVVAVVDGDPRSKDVDVGRLS